jgi:hypothetical protein
LEGALSLSLSLSLSHTHTAEKVLSGLRTGRRKVYPSVPEMKDERLGIPTEVSSHIHIPKRGIMGYCDRSSIHSSLTDSSLPEELVTLS